MKEEERGQRKEKVEDRGRNCAASFAQGGQSKKGKGKEGRVPLCLLRMDEGEFSLVRIERIYGRYDHRII